MTSSPLAQIQAVTEIEPAEDETIREYVSRVATECNVEQELLEAGLAYVTEHHFSDGSPEDDRAFEEFLRAIEGASDGVAESAPGADASRPTTGEIHTNGDPLGEATDSSGLLTDAEGHTPGQDARERAQSTVIGLPSDPGSHDTTAGFKTGIQGKEPRTLLLRFLIVVVTAPVIGWMLSRAWIPGNLVYEQGRELLTQLLGVPGPDAAQLFALGVFGFYLGMLVLFTLDVKKRVQAMLLWLGTVLGLVAVAYSGWVIPNLELTQLNVLGFALGLTAGVVVELDQLRAIDRTKSSFRRPTLSDGGLPEFRYAAWLLFGVLVLVVTATLVQVILAESVTVYDPFAALIFLGMLFGFVRYESETNYITLGPERSGKSMLMLGLCLELLRNAETHPEPNSYLQNGLERASNLQPGQAKWPISSTAHDELRAASFEVISGYYFPRRLELTALDYAGQHLSRIADLIDAGETDGEPDDSVPAQVVDWVVEADTLLFILDVERLVYPEEFHEGDHDEGAVSWGLEHYTTMTDSIDPDETILVASKCDILIDQGHVGAPDAYDSYDGFRDAVTEHLATRPDVQELLVTTGESTINPVYFVTEHRDEEYTPHLDEDGNLVPVGYDQLIDEMRGRQ